MQTWEQIALAAGAGLGALGLAAGGAAYAASWPTSQIFGRTLIDVPEPLSDGRHTVALTYDDGPSPRNTPALLELLAKHDVRATFFLIGNHVRKHPEIARAVVAAGHAVGNHTDMHPALARKSEERIRVELETCQKTLQDVLGVRAALFRPPYGSRRPAVFRILRELDLTPVMWNVTAVDWETIGEARILGNVDRGLQRNRRRGRTSNLLLHDASHLDGDDPHSRADTVAVTAALLRRRELQWVTIDTWLPQWLAADGEDAGAPLRYAAVLTSEASRSNSPRSRLSRKDRQRNAE